MPNDSNDCVAICELNSNKVLGLLCLELNTFGGNWKSIQTSKKIRKHFSQ